LALVQGLSILRTILSLGTPLVSLFPLEKPLNVFQNKPSPPPPFSYIIPPPPKSRTSKFSASHLVLLPFPGKISSFQPFTLAAQVRPGQNSHRFFSTSAFTPPVEKSAHSLLPFASTLCSSYPRPWRGTHSTPPRSIDPLSIFSLDPKAIPPTPPQHKTKPLVCARPLSSFAVLHTLLDTPLPSFQN